MNEISLEQLYHVAVCFEKCYHIYKNKFIIEKEKAATKLNNEIDELIEVK